MTTQELIEALDNRYGNPNAKGLELIQEAIARLRELNDMINNPVVKWALPFTKPTAWKLFNGSLIQKNLLKQC